MISFVKKFSGIGVSEIWFADKFSFKHSFRLAAYMHVKKPAGKILGISQNTHTVENDLHPSETATFNGFSKTVQTEVRQAERYGVDCMFTDDAEKFTAFYNEFAVSRQIDATSVKRLQEMQPFLKLSIAAYNGNWIAAHSYLTDKQAGVVRLMHAASQRLNTEVDKQLAGKANKLLHYFDMMQFKQQGYTLYDFGGYANNTADKGLQGINKFKLSFGGAVTVCENYATYPYYILKKIAAATGKLGKA
jgi:lipid II:glycine glycyltransferase (peptidoglycan interpeptide bridge formation enzyme)